MTKYVYYFGEGYKSLKSLLGGKGVNLSEMTNLGLPVPEGFAITTEAVRFMIFYILYKSYFIYFSNTNFSGL